MSIRKNKIFPWRRNNSFKLLINGCDFYPKMLQAIAQAQSIILLETYFVESGEISNQFVDALVAAAKRGVHTFVLFDDMGARGFSDMNKNDLQDNGVNLRFYNPMKIKYFLNNFYRDHRKLLLIDNQLAYVGGAGLSDQFIGDEYWRDNMIEIRGSVVLDWHTLYRQNWQKTNTVTIPSFTANIKPATTAKARGKVSYTRGYFFNQIKKNLFVEINKSQSRVWLASAYFVPSLKLRRLLCRAANRGVDIKLMVPGIKTDNNMARYIGQGYYARLLKKGVRIFEYQNHFIHSKVVLVDHWVTIGSSNLDRWSAKWNLEANQEIRDETFAQSVYDMYLADLQSCDEITLEKWSKRSVSQKFKVWFWKYMGKLIAKIGLNGRK